MPFILSIPFVRSDFVNFSIELLFLPFDWRANEKTKMCCDLLVLFFPSHLFRWFSLIAFGCVHVHSYFFFFFLLFFSFLFNFNFTSVCMPLFWTKQFIGKKKILASVLLLLLLWPKYCLCYRFDHKIHKIRYKVIMRTGLGKQTKIITICWFMPRAL